VQVPQTKSAGRESNDEGKRVGIESTLERLRGMILSGEIPPGAVVSQLKMAEQLGVSTTPLREAMRQLQVEGLLEAELNMRPRVPELDLDDLHAVYAARIMLESLAISLTVANLDDDAVSVIQADLVKMRRLAKPGDLERWEVAHTAFHRRLIAGVSPAMRPPLTNFFDRAERYRRLSILRDEPRGWSVADQEHERIVDACVARDPQTAAAELATHLARTAIALSAAFGPEVDPEPVRRAVALITQREQRRGRSGRR
jgi:DNA-binding GntR family transcriptional regulator